VTDTMTKLTGLFPAPAVPFAPDSSLAEDEFSSYMTSTGAIEGVSGVAVNGHAGEVVSLTEAERLRVVSIARDAMPAGKKVIAGVDPAVASWGIDTLHRTAEAGADAVLVVPPFDFMSRRAIGRSTQAAVQYFEELATAGVPIVVFQYPHTTGCDYTTEALSAIADIDNVIGLKNAVWHAELYVEQYHAVKDKISVLAACDAPELFSMMMTGADGLLLGASGVGTELWAGYVRNMADGDYDEARQVFVERLMPILDATFGVTRYRSATFSALTKHALFLMGAFTSARVRLPEVEPSPEDQEHVKRALASIGLI